MNKTQFYLSQCANAASKSPMCFTLGAVLVKGGKVISSGYNHHRPHYDGADVRTRGHRKPVSMHAEMHAIFSFTGMSPSFRKQQGGARAGRAQAGAATHPRPHHDHHGHHHDHLKARRPSLHARGTRSSSSSSSTGAGTFNEPSPMMDSVSSPQHTASKQRAVRPEEEAEKAWSARRRDPRINGADIYVARVTKAGMGSARPCWRCVEWCRWAGVKRIFHWNGEDGKFDMVKVNTAERDQYETHADVRLFAGMVSMCRSFFSLDYLFFLMPCRLFCFV
ncbi:hypothetical protein BJV74DRAFT_899020 [Russula compacta]|nr:hypothetical protein BJV74DRAFT_899020 [Russula compacta]